MKKITEQEAQRIIKDNKEETKKIIDEGGKITNTIIQEKEKTTTIRKIELANGKTTSSTIIQTKEGITIK